MAIARPRRVAWITIFPLNSTHRMASWCCKYPMLRHTFLRNDATSLCFPTNDTATYFRRFASLVATPTAIASMMGLARLLPAGVSADRTGGNAPSISETTRRIASDRSATNTSPPFLLPARPAICLYSPAVIGVIPARVPSITTTSAGKSTPTASVVVATTTRIPRDRIAVSRSCRISAVNPAWWKQSPFWAAWRRSGAAWAAARF